MAAGETRTTKLSGGRGVRNHRAYHEAMLRVLEDGQVHHKDEITMAGVAQVAPFDALGSFQRRNPEAEKALGVLSGQPRMQEAMRQQAMGARHLVSQAMSHLVDRGLMDVEEKDHKGVRTHYRITSKGREFLANPEEEPEVKIAPQVRSEDQVPCRYCGEPLYSEDPSTLRLQLCWFRKRESGGTNSARPVGKVKGYAHEGCVKENVSAETVSDLTIEDVMEAVCSYFNITTEQMIGPSVKDKVTIPRTIGYYLAHKLVTNSYMSLTLAFKRAESTLTKGMQRTQRDLEARSYFTIDGVVYNMDTVILDLETQLSGI